MFNMLCPEKRGEKLERRHSCVFFISAQDIQGKETQLKMLISFQVDSVVAKKSSSIPSC